VPGWVTFSVAPVSPLISLLFLNQVYEVPHVAVNVVEPPPHIEVLAGEIVQVGAEATVTVEVLEACPVQSP
jgi:hypothetical protein